MSASREKKLRQEEKDAGMSPKQLKAAEEKRKKKKNLIIGIVSGILVAAVILVGVYAAVIKPAIEPKKAALSLDGHELSAAEFNYYYVDSVYAFCNSYGSYLNYILDPSIPLDEQFFDEENKQTWADYFVEEAANAAQSTYAVYDEAIAKGFTLSQADLDELDATMESLEATAKASNFTSADGYLAAAYGQGSKVSTFRAYQEVQRLAAAYANSVTDSLEYSDADIAAKYAENPAEYTNVNYRSFYLTASNYKQADEELDEEKTAEYLKLAEADAAQMAADCQNDETLFASKAQELAAEGSKEVYEDPDYTLHESAAFSSVPDCATDWLYDSSRTAGDTTSVYDGTNGYYVLYFLSTDDNSYQTVSMRHILIKTDPDTDSDGDGTNESTSEESLKLAKDEAQSVLDAWLAGDATEESFATLADEKSSDSAEGGLYQNIYHNQMVAAVNDWCFDESRKPGDYDIVQSVYGYHVIYFVGIGDTYRNTMIIEDLKAADYDEWYNGVTGAVQPYEMKAGASYLNKSLVLSRSN